MDNWNFLQVHILNQVFEELAAAGVFGPVITASL